MTSFWEGCQDEIERAVCVQCGDDYDLYYFDIESQLWCKKCLMKNDIDDYQLSLNLEERNN